MPTITQLEYILAVSKLKHFGKASENCNVSQPSLSMQIQKAEDELGLQIFDRNKKPIAITEKGQIVVEQAQKMINEYQKLIQVSREETNEIKGEFQLGIIPTLSSSVIPLFVKAFSEAYPKVELFINELTTENIIEAIKLNEIDAGILATPLLENSLEEEVLFYEGFSVYCSPDHPLLKKKKLTPNEITKYDDLWILSDGHCFKNQVLNFCGVDSHQKVFNNIHFESGSLDTLRQLVKKAQGYTFLPQLHVAQLDSSETKWVRDFKNPIPSREVSLVFKKTHWKKDVIEALKNTLTTNLPDTLRTNKTSQLDVLAID